MSVEKKWKQNHLSSLSAPLKGPIMEDLYFPSIACVLHSKIYHPLKNFDLLGVALSHALSFASEGGSAATTSKLTLPN